MFLQNLFVYCCLFLRKRKKISCSLFFPDISQSLRNDNCKSLTTIVDVERAAIRIREEPNSSKKSDDKLESNDDNLSNGDLVANGSAPIVPNGNSRLSASSDRSRKDVSLGDIESRIPAGSPNHDGKRDTIVTVDTDVIGNENKVRDCCPSFCYCESVCCESYRDSCIRRSWHSLRENVLRFVEHKYFELFILIMIGVSSLTLVSIKSEYNTYYYYAPNQNNYKQSFINNYFY